MRQHESVTLSKIAVINFNTGKIYHVGCEKYEKDFDKASYFKEDGSKLVCTGCGTVLMGYAVSLEKHKIMMAGAKNRHNNRLRDIRAKYLEEKRQASIA